MDDDATERTPADGQASERSSVIVVSDERDARLRAPDGARDRVAHGWHADRFPHICSGLEWLRHG